MRSKLGDLVAFFIVLTTGCASESEDPTNGNCTGKCDGFGDAEELTTFTQTVTNADSIPRGFTTLGNKALFFSAVKKGLWISDGTAAGTKLVRDLDPTLDTFQATPRIAVLGSKAYWSFMGQLWSSDGTPAGTALVVDYGIPQPGESMTNVIAFGNSLVFGAHQKLYVSNGTPAGTIAISDFNVSDDFQIAGNSLYFPCTRADIGQELCVTDGTSAGTRLVKDIVPGTSGTSPRFLGVVGSRVVFSAQSNTSLLLRGVWATDGTDAGTVQVMPPASNGDTVGSSAEVGVVFGNRLFFQCYTTAAAAELCASDGTAAGTTVLDLASGTTSSGPASLQVLGNHLFFIATSKTLGRELWISDGTLAGSSVLVDLRTSTSDRDGVAGGRLVPFGNKLLFSARGPDAHQSLWATDGTAAGTVKVASPVPASAIERYKLSIDDATQIGNKLLFAADDGTNGLEPWVSDGTAQGTQLVLDILPPTRNLVVSGATTFGNGSFFAVGDNNATTVWRTNGTAGGTASFKQLEAQSAPGFTTAGSQLFFVGQSSLWKSDGTTGGTTKVIDLPGSGGPLVALGNKVGFIGTTNDQGYGLWLSDGTATGTVETPAVNAEYLAAANGRLWLTALSGGTGNELWSSDGTVAGTHSVAEINPTTNDSKPNGFVGLGGKTLFSAFEPVGGSEPWITDGTMAGTHRIADIAPGAASASPYGMFAWNDMVLMWARPGTAYELWRTDGTAAGTKRVKAISYGANGAFTAWGNYVFFSATDAAGTELWRTDGTEAGTVRVADLYAGPSSSNPGELTLASPTGPLYFVAEEPLGGRELWKLDTAGGTPTSVVNLLPGPHSSSPSHLQARGSALLFIADDGHGPALFRLGAAPDVIAPTITCPHAFTVTADQPDGAAVTFALPSASDNDDTPTVTTTPASGDKFPIGKTTVTATATDGAGNTASCTFDVTVALNDGSGSGSGSGSDGDGDGSMNGGGGCSATGTTSPLSLALFLGACLVRRRRRRHIAAA